MRSWRSCVSVLTSEGTLDVRLFDSRSLAGIGAQTG